MVRPGATGRVPAISPSLEEAAARGAGEHGLVRLRRRQLRILRDIERDLAGSCPDLDALFVSFGRRTYGLDLRWVEQTEGGRSRMFARLRHKRILIERATDWCAENQDDP